MLRDQQFVTLLLYLDNICIFTPTIDDMLDWIELVFDRLKQFHLKIKPKKCQFFDTSVLFLGHVLLANDISANPEKVEKVKTWPVPKTMKEVQSFLGLASYYRQLINKFAEKAQCLYKLVGPTSNKQKKKARAKKDAATVKETGQRIFEWMMKHQDAFDVLKEALSTAPVLGYADFSRKFILETDASLNGLGAILSQQGKEGQIHVIAYASPSFCSSERPLHNYSSVKLELLVLKWVVTEELRDYLLGSQFQVYTDNNPLAYVMESKLGAPKIWWLSELALLDFVIKYQTGHSNRAADALSHHPFNPSCNDSFTESETDSEEFEVISYSSVCVAVDLCLNSIKIPEDLKQDVQNITCAIMEEEDINDNNIVSSLNAVSTFEHITPKQMAEEQQNNPTLELVYQLVTAGEKPKTSAIAKNKIKGCEKILAPVW